MRQECYFCNTKVVEKLIKKFKPDSDTAEQIVYEFNKILHDNHDQANPLIATFVHRMVKQKLGNENLYFEEKQKANDQLLEQYDNWKDFALNSKNQLHTAAKLAVAGNIIDYGAQTASDDVATQIKEILSADLAIDDSELLFEQIKQAKSVLYLGDNAGEIVFDKLFIELLNHPNLTFVTRGENVINDVTLKDAHYVGINKTCKLISNGYDAPSTVLSKCSDEFMQLYQSADLIISKGQGNFEGLMNEKNPKIFFMLMAKCKPMAHLLGVEKGDMLIIQNKDQ